MAGCEEVVQVQGTIRLRQDAAVVDLTLSEGEPTCAPKKQKEVVVVLDSLCGETTFWYKLVL